MPAVLPHSLGKCLFLHLAPGVANVSATILGLAAFWSPSLPPELFFGVFASVFVLIPVQLGYLPLLPGQEAAQPRVVAQRHRCLWAAGFKRPNCLAASSFPSSKSSISHSLLFAAYHFDTPWMIPVRTFGILPLIYTTIHTHSVRPGITAHCLVNLANFSDSLAGRIGTQ